MSGLVRLRWCVAGTTVEASGYTREAADRIIASVRRDGGVVLVDEPDGSTLACGSPNDNAARVTEKDEHA